MLWAVIVAILAEEPVFVSLMPQYVFKIIRLKSELNNKHFKCPQQRHFFSVPSEISQFAINNSNSDRTLRSVSSPSLRPHIPSSILVRPRRLTPIHKSGLKWWRCRRRGRYFHCRFTAALALRIQPADVEDDNKQPKKKPRPRSR